MFAHLLFNSKYLLDSDSSTTGASGLKSSLFFTFLLIALRASLFVASAIIDLLPNALGPNSDLLS